MITLIELYTAKHYIQQLIDYPNWPIFAIQRKVLNKVVAEMEKEKQPENADTLTWVIRKIVATQRKA